MNKGNKLGLAGLGLFAFNLAFTHLTILNESAWPSLLSDLFLVTSLALMVVASRKGSRFWVLGLPGLFVLFGLFLIAVEHQH